MSRILEYLLAEQEAMIATLASLVALDSPSSEREAVNRVADFMSDALAATGGRVERLAQAAFGDHLHVSWGEGPRQILILGHMDTVWPAGEAQKRPFRIEEGRAQGPGAFDMKGGLVVGLYALRALQALALQPACRLVLVLNSDEECGSPTSRAIIEEEGRRSAASLVLEPSREGALVTWRKGVGRFEMEVQGLASHAGAAHERGVSAVQELAHQILRLEAMTNYGRGTTVNVGVIQGGSKVNVRPASAWAEIDLRVTAAEEGQRMAKTILALQPVHPAATLVVSGGMNRPPWEISPGGERLFRQAQRAGGRLGLELWSAGTGGGSDGNFTAALGTPTLDGLGPVGEDAHALTEWVDVGSLPVRSALLAELLVDLAE
jgi:glutamate carboxypeptidase